MTVILYLSTLWSWLGFRLEDQVFVERFDIFFLDIVSFFDFLAHVCFLRTLRQSTINKTLAVRLLGSNRASQVGISFGVISFRSDFPLFVYH